MYEANSLCPEEQPLIAEIERRSERVAGSSPAVQAWVTIRGSDSRVKARVVVRRAEGTIHREISGEGCDEVIRAAALIVAIALDSDAEADTAAEAAPAEAAPAEAAPPVTSRVLRAHDADADAEHRQRSPQREKEESAWWVGAGGLVGLTLGVSPNAVFSQGVFLEGGERANAWLAARFRLTGLRAEGIAETAGGTAELNWLALRAAGCPLGFGAGRFLELCATFDFGRLQGKSQKQRNATWFGPGAALRAGVLVQDLLTLGGDFGVVAPLARDRFYFRPDLTAHRIPVLAGYGLLWLGLRT